MRKTGCVRPMSPPADRDRGRFGSLRSLHLLADVERRRKKERASLTQLAGTTDPSTHQLHQALADGQSETRSAVLARGGGIGLRETLENHFRFVRGDPDPGIHDVESQPPPCRSGSRRSIGSGSTRSVTEPCSVNFSAFPIRLIRICRRRFGSPTSPMGTPGRTSRVSRKPRSCARDSHHLDYLFEQSAQIEADRFQFDVPGLHLGKIQNIVDQSRAGSPRLFGKYEHSPAAPRGADFPRAGRPSREWRSWAFAFHDSWWSGIRSWRDSRIPRTLWRAADPPPRAGA